MKKKTSVVGTLQIISILLIVFQCVALFFYNKPIFYVGIAAAVIIAIGSFVSHRRLRQRVHQAILDSANIAAGQSREILENFAVPVVCVSANGKFSWGNKAFSHQVFPLNEILNEKTSSLFDNDTYSKLLDKGVCEAAIGNRIFNVCAIKSDKNILLYFEDQTVLKKLSAEYRFSRPVAAILQIDALDEILKNEKEAKKAKVRSDLQAVVENWFSSANGVMYALSSDRYLMIFEYRHLKRFEDERFSILEEVRNRDFEGYNNITVSIGVGYGAKDLHECETIARASLDMALGRGGDQAVLKHKENDYKFFGGVKAGNERGSKVRARVTAKTVCELIKHSQRVVIMGHRFADLDCLGASFALAVLADSLGAEPNIIIERNGGMADSLLDYIKQKGYSEMLAYENEVLDRIDQNTLVIVVDTHRPDFLISKNIIEKAHKTVVIDHHRTAGDHIKNAIIFYNETVTSSACELVTEILQYCGNEAINADSANALMAGIMLDTKNFVLGTGVRTYEAAAFLRRKGSDPVAVKKFFADSLDIYKAKNDIVASASQYKNCAIATNFSKDANVRLASAQAADELMGVNDVKASFVLFNVEDSVCISSRSYGEVNVQIIMEKLGGGGHRTMAATAIENTDITSAEQLLKSTIDEYFSER